MIRRLTKNDMRELSIAEQNKSSLTVNDTHDKLPFLRKREDTFGYREKGRGNATQHRLLDANSKIIQRAVNQNANFNSNRKMRSLKISPIKRTISTGLSQPDLSNELLYAPKLNHITSSSYEHEPSNTSILVTDKQKSIKNSIGRVRFKEEFETQDLEVTLQNITPIKNTSKDTFGLETETTKTVKKNGALSSQSSKLRLKELKREIALNCDLFYNSFIEQHIKHNAQFPGNYLKHQNNRKDKYRCNLNSDSFTKDEYSFNNSSINIGRRSISFSSIPSHSITSDTFDASADGLSNQISFNNEHNFTKEENITYVSSDGFKNDTNSPFNLSSESIREFCKEEDYWKKSIGSWFIEPLLTDSATNDPVNHLNINPNSNSFHDTSHSYIIKEMVMRSLKKTSKH
ncbi:hypothetical protein TPHA_0F03440 [Tetrapisispora phaffii CBS 4417]|uniref:Uncharacterized protein n=1 Tax=Tetrapisispora phaffii (strain ATCC 24235 / CBS 4417 / NBRC 1672 / NRRL Y-8282 / UCD 70-5) TaxID=1071381 RepID=G8BUN8_TETPH|nr:hypothetical protein TPHA_0F03440 [Tetrapisispora phaffii CBS 4417]CCE63824.1 hypothetical protein TPHA_0F03440 [Tetrapisispora phaffii CBS 4417]